MILQKFSTRERSASYEPVSASCNLLAIGWYVSALRYCGKYQFRATFFECGPSWHVACEAFASAGSETSEIWSRIWGHMHIAVMGQQARPSSEVLAQLTGLAGQSGLHVIGRIVAQCRRGVLGSHRQLVVAGAGQRNDIYYSVTCQSVTAHHIEARTTPRGREPVSQGLNPPRLVGSHVGLLSAS